MIDPTDMVTNAAPAPADASSTPPRRHRLILLAMCLATFMTSLDVTIVNVALPSMQSGLQLSASDLEWVVGAYSLSLAALIPAGGALGDRYGRKRVFLAGMVVFVVGFVACALSSNAVALVAFRGLQGVGGSAMLALALSIITETYPARQRAGAIGTWAAIGGSGFGAGPVAGGILLSFFGWQSVFWVNLPFAVLGILATTVAVREFRNPDARRLDLPGLLLGGSGLAGLTFGFIESAGNAWDSLWIVAPVATGVVLLGAFFWWEGRAPHALAPRALLRARGFAAGAAIYLLAFGGLSGALFWVTLYYQDVAGWSVLRTGLSWLLMSVPYLLMAQFCGRLDARLSTFSIVVAGTLVAAVGVFLLSRAGTGVPFAVSALGYLLYGAGFGTFVPATTHAALRDVPAGISGAASGVLNASRQIGSCVCLAVLGTAGLNAAESAWRSGAARAGDRTRALAQAQNVGGGRVHVVVGALGSRYAPLAVDSFLHGYRLAVGLSAVCTAAAAAVACAGFGRRRSCDRPETRSKL